MATKKEVTAVTPNNVFKIGNLNYNLRTLNTRRKRKKQKNLNEDSSICLLRKRKKKTRKPLKMHKIKPT